MIRRHFLRGLLAAPAVVAFGNIMPVRAVPYTGPEFRLYDQFNRLIGKNTVNLETLENGWAYARCTFPALAPGRIIERVTFHPGNHPPIEPFSAQFIASRSPLPIVPNGGDLSIALNYRINPDA